MGEGGTGMSWHAVILFVFFYFEENELGFARRVLLILGRIQIGQ